MYSYPENKNTASYGYGMLVFPAAPPPSMGAPWVPSPSRAHLEAQTTIDKGRKLLEAEGKDRKGG